MNRLLTALLFVCLTGCRTVPDPSTSPPAPASQVSVLTADTPQTTAEGNAFIAPVGWSVTRRGPATVVAPPEVGSAIAIIDVKAADAEAAVAAAWQAYRPDFKWPLKVVTAKPDREGWTDCASYSYQTSPNEKRDVSVRVQRANDVWTVVVYDMDQGVGEKRLSQVVLVLGELHPRGHAKESFAGKQAHQLDAARIAELTKFIETSMEVTRVPGVALGLVENGKVVFADGFGLRAIGSNNKIDGDTRFMVASNTKALTTLMLARLVDEGKLTWETPVTSVLPSFKLGDAQTTARVQVKHLICACTGLPRQDFEWLFQFEGVTCDGAMATLATMQPTSAFGEIFQYSNPLAGAGGFVGGHVAYPKLELGAAYDKAMQKLVFDPLKMKRTTFDYVTAQKGNFARPYSVDIAGKTAPALMELNYAVIPVRPAGAAWSTVRDMLAYVAMELSKGKLPDGSPYVGEEALLARRAPQVALGKDGSYGMGLMVDREYDVTLVHHGGDVWGYHSDMMWLPEHGVGAVVLTNGDPGWLIRSQFRRKLLEVLFDGRPEADAQVAARAKAFFEQLAAEAKLLTLPADEAEASRLANSYANLALGEIAVKQNYGAKMQDGQVLGQGLWFDFGEWRSEMASRVNPDGTRSFMTIAPGIIGLEFVVGELDGRRTLTVRDAQHEYLFVEEGA